MSDLQDVRRLIIVRGPPGSGKTPYAEQLATELGNAKVASIDYYFSRYGSYQFNASKIPVAYGYVQGMVEAFMEEQAPIIIVDGVHPKEYHLKPYVNMADTWGYKVEINYPREAVELYNLDKCFENSTHKIPRPIISSIITSFQRDIDFERIRKEIMQQDKAA